MAAPARQPITLSLGLDDLRPIVTAAQAVVALLAGVPQFLYLSSFSADKVRYIYIHPISFEREIGGTVYTVNAHFSGDAQNSFLILDAARDALFLIVTGQSGIENSDSLLIWLLFLQNSSPVYPMRNAWTG